MLKNTQLAHLLFFLLLGMLPGLAQGQQMAAAPELSLAELVKRALEENYQVRIFQNIARTSENNNTIGNAGMLPNVSLSGERRTAINNSQQSFFTGDTQEATNARRTSTSASLDANWIVFDGLAMFARKNQQEELESLSREDTRFFMEQTLADLIVAYYRLRQESQLLAAFRKSLEVSRARVAFEEKSLEVGASNRLNLQLARVDYNTDSSLVLNQEAQLQETSIAINRLINRDLAQAIVPVDSIRLQSAFSLPDLLETARERNTSLNQQQLRELIALSESEIARGSLFPEVELYGRVDFNRQVNEFGFLQSSRTFGPEYGIRVRFNLFSGRQQYTARQNAEINVQTERLRAQDTWQQVEASLQVAYLRWLNRNRQVRLERQSMAAAEVALQIARRQYELGALTQLEFRQIQLNAVNAETRFLEARFLAKSREIELLRLSGTLLDQRW